MAEANDRPLSGIKVVELAMWVAGPSCSAVLGDWLEAGMTWEDIAKLKEAGVIS